MVCDDLVSTAAADVTGSHLIHCDKQALALAAAGLVADAMERYKESLHAPNSRKAEIPIVSPGSSVCDDEEQPVFHVVRPMQGWMPSEVSAQFDDFEMVNEFCQMFSHQNELDLINEILFDAL